MYILISNVGSTSLKFKLYRMPEEEVLCEAKIKKSAPPTAYITTKMTSTVVLMERRALR